MSRRHGRGRDGDARGDEVRDADGGDGEAPFGDEPAPLPMNGVLDLHQFPPREAADLVRDWLDECVAHGLRDVRIVHGKGVGELRRLVHAVLSRHAAVESYGLATDASAWGATLVRLRGAGAPGPGATDGGGGDGPQGPGQARR